MTISTAFEEISDETSREYLEGYFGLGEGNPYSGAHFNSFGTNEPNAITADDLIAVACLSKHVPAGAALGILGDHSAKIAMLLSFIPPDLSIEDIPLDEHNEYFGEGTPSWRRWWLLRRDKQDSLGRWRHDSEQALGP
jgi:hypothetical protein